MGFLKSLFGFTDRVGVASDRAAAAMEDIADTLEAARDALRSRLGVAGTQDGPEAVVDAGERQRPALTRRNGRTAP